MTERACTFTASEDKTLRMWKAGKCERVFHGKYRVIQKHLTVLRTVTFLQENFDKFQDC